MFEVSRSRLKSLLVVGALLGIAVFSLPSSVGATEAPAVEASIDICLASNLGVVATAFCVWESMAPPEEGVCIERNLGGGMIQIDCGTHRWCYQNNVFAGAC